MSAHCILLHILAEFRKGKNTKISELAESMQISRQECISSLQLLVSQLEELGYTLLSGHTSRIDESGKTLSPDATTVQYTHLSESFKKCDFVYLVKTRECTEEENEFVNRHVSEIVFVYTVLYLNGSEMEYERVVSALWQIGGKEELLKEIISKKYFNKKKRNEEFFVRPCWKFFLEFPKFSPQEYIASLKSSSVV
ncbi:hypothetical protein NEMIN01_1920 [Nematocida minor]|uniref:uncharacterized protein n=1 Tax=Nematocida minor TaxID=1912983 RepID=UPI00221EA20F|nr:uncharacterized protein NEMIN01_1920 [Nematocida minor]KAI5192268.1 hypothetical protein NEMIN01_1920 [Nematocida minor]